VWAIFRWGYVTKVWFSVYKSMFKTLKQMRCWNCQFFGYVKGMLLKVEKVLSCWVLQVELCWVVAQWPSGLMGWSELHGLVQDCNKDFKTITSFSPLSCCYKFQVVSLMFIMFPINYFCVKMVYLDFESSLSYKDGKLIVHCCWCIVFLSHGPMVTTLWEITFIKTTLPCN